MNTENSILTIGERKHSSCYASQRQLVFCQVSKYRIYASLVEARGRGQLIQNYNSTACETC